jgi:hypothetical protein
MSVMAGTPASITTPGRVQTRLGELESDDGAPAAVMAEVS